MAGENQNTQNFSSAPQDIGETGPSTDLSASQMPAGTTSIDNGVARDVSGKVLGNVNAPQDTAAATPASKVDYAAIAQKYGGHALPAQPVDYAAIAKKYGGMPVPAQAATPAPQPTGVLAAGKRMTVDALTGMYHAFNDPATDQEKADVLAKIRAENANIKDPKNRIPEDLATNPSRATLALHRILDAPATTLAKKGRDEVTTAQDLINHHEYWKGGNLYLSGLADKLLSAVPVIGPAVNAEAERMERGDISGAVTGSLLAGALTNPTGESSSALGALDRVAGKTTKQVPRAVGEAVGEAVAKTSEQVSNAAGEAANKINTTELRPDFLVKRGPTPAPQHGAPVNVESPLDGPTVGNKLGGKDLSSEALSKLKEHAGDTIPVGSSPKNRLAAAVEPTSNAINTLSSKMNQAVKDAPSFTTSVAQDSVFGEGTLTKSMDEIKSNLPASVREALSKDVDGVMTDADKALNSTDPVEVLEYRRRLGGLIDWDNVAKNPQTAGEAQNLARVKVYKALGDKIHEIPETVELDKQLSPNLELRSHMRTKLGEMADDPLRATSEAQSEFKKGKTTIENAIHNEAVKGNWLKVKAALVTLGLSSSALGEISHLLGLF
jgi:hypothetical protein